MQWMSPKKNRSEILMEPLLEFRDVVKKYGAKSAVDHVSFQIQPGKIVGLLGSNGSGKSTIMKIAAGITHPTSGQVLIDGTGVGIKTKAITSFMPDSTLTDEWMRVKDAIAFYQDNYADFDSSKAKDMIDFMKLNNQDRVNTLSKGMKERLQLTLTLSRNAKLYMLDEPIGGVDPVARGKILDAIVEYYNEESSIIVSTHLLQDIERIFDEVILVKNGKLLLQDEVENIRINKKKSIDELFKEVYAEC